MSATDAKPDYQQTVHRDRGGTKIKTFTHPSARLLNRHDVSKRARLNVVHPVAGRQGKGLSEESSIGET